jgi:uncharacterized protein
MKAPAALEPFDRRKTVLLTTHRRDGTPVGTPVHIVVDGDRTFVRTWDTTGKLKRIRNDPSVEICPSTVGGRPTGPGIRARARVLEGDESAYAGRILSRKYLALHGFLIPLVHRLRGNETIHIEPRPIDNGEVPA